MITVFFSYSHRDEEYRNELEIHLSMLKRQGIIETWHDRRIGAGKEVHGEISGHLEKADVVLLLVSPYFLASEYCYDVEMMRALERHKSGDARVIPVIVHPCDWKSAPFGSLRATPTDGKPISKFPVIHDAYLSIVQDIRDAAEELSASKGAKPTGDERPIIPSRTTAVGPDLRSSNLRVKQEFSDRDRDQFRLQTFEYIANFFENSLAELERRNAGVQTQFRRADRNHFTAAIYHHGKKQSACRIWLGIPFVGDIAYAVGDAGADNSYNEVWRVVDDGYSLLLRSLGMQSSSSSETLTQQGAAEYLWSMLVEPLQ